MVIRVSEVSVVEEPHITDIRNLIVFPLEELLKVLCWFKEISKPDQSWQIIGFSLEELASQLYLIVLLLVCGL